MEFTFKTLPYQTEAVESIVRVFEGQEFSDGIRHRHDMGTKKDTQATFDEESGVPLTEVGLAYRNNDLTNTSEQILKNIQAVQKDNGIPVSEEIADPLGAVTLDVEMETGTGKTYVYTKAMFELNKRYGWNKFIIVVPSIAIREGVYKSIQTTESHFMEQYGKKLRAFIYSSSDLYKIDEFSQSSGINVMIINSQAFAASFKEDGKNEQSRIIYSVRDEFQSRRPIDIIAANRPILILDEPQKLGKDDSKTQKALRKHFNALFSMNFSATHVTHHNQVYSLDALDAYNQKLVKKIRVKGVRINHLSGSERYIYLEGIDAGKTAPTARMEIFVSHSAGIRNETHIFRQQDNLYETSNHIESYKGLFITDIDGLANTVTLSDGTVLFAGEAVGDITESGKRRIQIRETILSHLDQESKLFSKGIKVLSLFFIDEVAKYRQYDDDGNERLGEYGEMFEQEFRSIIAERGKFYDPDYIDYLTNTDVSKIHSGYFSIDKKGRAIDSEVKRGQDGSQDVSAYDLILKNKELLLSQSNPVRFIFSHSALREGWDNPNVFQICTLKQSSSEVRKRQEVGRGLRLCVNQDGERMDVNALGSDVHTVNILTVIASESYDSFARGLQEELADAVAGRPVAVTADLFKGKVITDIKGNEQVVDADMAQAIFEDLISNGYVKRGVLTDKYYADKANGEIKVAEEVADSRDAVIKILDTVYDANAMKPENSRDKNVELQVDPEKLAMPEFKALWKRISPKSVYVVDFDTDELVKKSIDALNTKLHVPKVFFNVEEGDLNEIKSKDEIKE